MDVFEFNITFYAVFIHMLDAFIHFIRCVKNSKYSLRTGNSRKDFCILVGNLIDGL